MLRAFGAAGGWLVFTGTFNIKEVEQRYDKSNTS